MPEFGVLSNLVNLKNDIEKMLFQFQTRHSQELGEIITEILLLQKKQKQQEAEQAPDDETKQKEFEEAETDYKEYQQTFEESSKEQIFELNEQEEISIKDLYRKSVKLCHPDTVEEDFKEEAAKIFVELKEAFDANDIKRMHELNDYLTTGKPFTPLHKAEANKKTNISTNTRYEINPCFVNSCGELYYSWR